jgi:glycosyltransferase involved in cell wall biosynthesis
VAALQAGYGISTEDKMLLFAGRLAQSKGVFNLLTAMPFVLHSFPNVKLLLVGEGDEAKVGRIRELIVAHNLQDHIHCTFQFVPKEELLTFYTAADVCVIPSL